MQAIYEKWIWMWILVCLCGCRDEYVSYAFFGDEADVEAPPEVTVGPVPGVLCCVDSRSAGNGSAHVLGLLATDAVWLTTEITGKKWLVDRLRASTHRYNDIHRHNHHPSRIISIGRALPQYHLSTENHKYRQARHT